MPEVSKQGKSKPGTWVIVWTAQENQVQRVPTPFNRGDEAQCPFEKALDLALTWAPKERVAPVVLRAEKPWWARPVDAVPAENLAEQPFDRGSAPGILLAVLRIYRKDRDARVVLLSAGSDLVASSHVNDSLSQVGGRDDVVILAQAQPAHGVAAPRRQPVAAYRRVKGEWRLALRAGEARGGGIIVASAGALLQLFIDTQPELTDQFLTTLTGPSLFDEVALDRLYPFLPETDFHAGVLNRALNARPPRIDTGAKTAGRTSRVSV